MELKVVNQVFFPVLPQEIKANVRAVGCPFEIEEAGLRTVDL
jgi:hypothetical protein